MAKQLWPGRKYQPGDDVTILRGNLAGDKGIVTASHGEGFWGLLLGDAGEVILPSHLWEKEVVAGPRTWHELLCATRYGPALAVA